MDRLIIYMRNGEGGVATYIRNFLQYRNPELFYVKLVLVEDDGTGFEHVDENFNAAEIVHFSYNKYENLYFVLKRLAKQIESPDDIIWANERLELTMLNLFKLPNKVIHVLHGDSSYYYQNLAKFNRGVEGFVAASEWIYERAQGIIRKEGGTSLVKKIFAPVREIPPGDQKPGDICRIVYVGRIDRAKGMHHLMGICHELDKLSIPYRVTLVGSGNLVDIIKSESHRIKGEILFTGFLPNDEVLKLLADQEFLLFPSYSEAVGLSVVEAMKAGVVPITSDLNSGLPEIVINGETGYRVPTGDEKAFADKIAGLYRHPDQYAEMRLKAIQLANELFNPVKQTGQIELFITQVISGKFVKQQVYHEYGYRLDSKYIPAVFVKAARKFFAKISK